MNKDKILALCDAIDEEADSADSVTDLSQLTSHLKRFTDAIRAEVEKSLWIKVFDDDTKIIVDQAEQLGISPEKFVNKILYNYLVSDDPETTEGK